MSSVPKDRLVGMSHDIYSTVHSTSLILMFDPSSRAYLDIKIYRGILCSNNLDNCCTLVAIDIFN